ncbi:MAG: 3-phosphoshikimate 1-carboxyvinyltransferase [Dehalococcoidia bacterium]
MATSVRRPARLRGTVHLPGDKSISHRAAMLGALATGMTRARGFLAGADTLATLDCLRALGVESEIAGTTLSVHGVGMKGLRAPADVLDARNSGTTLRILSGVLAGQPFESTIDGDESLRARPVDRIVTPLRQMGAQISARDGDRLPPLTIKGGGLHGIRYRLPVASAQVKSCVLLAGLFADGETIVEEPQPTRDHTERMLRAMGADIQREGPAVRIVAPAALAALDLDVPADLSSAAFWLVAAAVHPDAEVTLPGVGVNPTRSGILEVLSMMGADIEVGETRLAGEEPVADITVRSSRLQRVELAGDLMPRVMDELPVIAVAAAFAEGVTTVRDASELRVKEMDRIAVLVRELGELGAAIEERPDGFVVRGGSGLSGHPVSGSGDHRLTMALAIAGLVADGETVVEDAESVAVSYPEFWRDLEALGG